MWSEGGWCRLWDGVYSGAGKLNCVVTWFFSQSQKICTIDSSKYWPVRPGYRHGIGWYISSDSFGQLGIRDDQYSLVA